MVRLNFAVVLRRSGSGLGVLAIVSACIVPVFVMVASEHRDHWSGTAGVEFWETFVTPWAGRVWCLTGLVVLGGWSAGAAPPSPIRGQGVFGGALLGLLGVLVYLGASLPGWVWLVRLGGVAAEHAALIAFWSSVPLLICGPVGGLVRPLAGYAGAALGSGVVGGGLLWACWSLA